MSESRRDFLARTAAGLVGAAAVDTRPPVLLTVAINTISAAVF